MAWSFPSNKSPCGVDNPVLIIQCWRHSLLPTVHGDTSLYANLSALCMLLSPLLHHSPALSLPKLMLCLDIWCPTSLTSSLQSLSPSRIASSCPSDNFLFFPCFSPRSFSMVMSSSGNSLVYRHDSS